MNTDKIYAEHLANEYAPKDDFKVITLRKLDARAKLPATVFTYTVGVTSALIAGVGMCLSMNVIGNGSSISFVLGVIIGLVGLAGMGLNYPVYKKILAKGKQKYAFEIMELAKEITEEKKKKKSFRIEFLPLKSKLYIRPRQLISSYSLSVAVHPSIYQAMAVDFLYYAFPFHDHRRYASGNAD